MKIGLKLMRPKEKKNHLQIVSFSSLANVLLRSFPILLQRLKKVNLLHPGT